MDDSKNMDPLTMKVSNLFWKHERHASRSSRYGGETPFGEDQLDLSQINFIDKEDKMFKVDKI